MRTLIFILQKEFIQVFRNKTMLPIIFIMPLIQLLILVNAATFELKNVSLCVIDFDLSASSRQLVAKFDGSPFFEVNKASFRYTEAENFILSNKTDLVLTIPAGFEKNIKTGQGARVQVMIDAVDGMAAGLINAYSTQIIQSFNRESGANAGLLLRPVKNILVTSSFWYNPELDYKAYMVPGILVILVTMIGMFLTALNIVREKEIGTIEQINVTPVRKIHFIVGKLIPFWVIALVELTVGLVIGVLLFKVPIVGSLWLLYAFAAIYLVIALSIGLFFSSISSTQQQVMFVAFFTMITGILMSGIFTPEESMPGWARAINVINPFAYFMRVIRLVLLKGSGFSDIWHEFAAISLLAILMLGLAVKSYKKRS